MAKRTNGGTTPPGRSRTGSDPNAGNGEARRTLAVKTNDKGQIFSHIRQKWLIETPEERVRQTYVVMLHNEYGFNLDQMDEEVHALASRGSARARADVVLWRTAQDKSDSKSPLIVIECKADNITIKAARNHFRARAKFTTNLASINSNDLRELALPLPPVPVQQAIVKRVATGRAEIFKLKADAKTRADAAKEDVEAMILGTKPVE